MTKKWLLLFLLLFLLAGLRLCTTQQETTQAKSPALVGFINLEDGRAFSGTIQAAFQKLAADTPDIHVEYYNGADDVQLQNQRIHELVEQDAKAIILMAADSTGVAPGIQEANAAGIPVISLNTRSFGGTSTYVGVLDYDAGWKQGKYMLENLPPNARLAYIAGPSNTLSAQQRMQGFIDACLLKRADLSIVAVGESPYSQRCQAAMLMKQWLRHGIRPTAVAAASDEIAIGALQAMKELGCEQNVMISGINASKEACQLVKEGELAQTIRQDASSEAQGAYDALLKIIRDGNRHPDDIIIPVISVTKENVAEITNTND